MSIGKARLIHGISIRTGRRSPPSAAPPESDTKGKAGGPSNLLELIQAVNACLLHLGGYTAARTALVRHALSVRNLPGGPWRSQFTRQKSEGELHFSGVPTAAPVGTAVPENQPVEGVAMVRDDNPHAPFRDFRLIDAAGNPPAAGTQAEAVQARYGFYLARTGEAVNALLALLPLIECVHVDGADTQSLTQLRIALPKPPYLPLRELTLTFRAVGDGWDRNIKFNTDERGAPCDKWEEIVAEEGKLIDAVRLQLHRLVARAQQKDVKPETVEATKAEPSNPATEAQGPQPSRQALDTLRGASQKMLAAIDDGDLTDGVQGTHRRLGCLAMAIEAWAESKAIIERLNTAADLPNVPDDASCFNFVGWPQRVSVALSAAWDMHLAMTRWYKDGRANGFGPIPQQVRTDLAKIVDVLNDALAAAEPKPQPTTHFKATAGAAAGYCSPSEIAKAMNAPDSADAIRKALKRLFDEDLLPGSAWVENSDPAKGQARILYKLSAVRPLLSRFERPAAG